MLDGLSDLAGIYVLPHQLTCETDCDRIDDTPPGKTAFGGVCACASCTEQIDGQLCIRVGECRYSCALSLGCVIVSKTATDEWCFCHILGVLL